MAFTPTPRGIRVVFGMTLATIEVSSQLQFLGGAPASLPDLEFLADFARDNWVARIMPLLSNELLYRQTQAYALDSATAPVATLAETGTVQGGVGQAALPGNVAMCVTLRTAARGRSGRGRIYLPGIPEGAVSGREMPGTLVNAWNAAILQFYNVFTSNGYTPVVISTQSNNVPLAAGVPRPITSMAIRDGRVDSQRRRLGR